MKKISAVIALALVASGWLLLRRLQASDMCRQTLGFAWAPASTLLLEPLRDPGLLLNDYRERRERISNTDFQALADLIVAIGAVASERGWQRLGVVITQTGTALVAELAQSGPRGEMQAFPLSGTDRELVHAALGDGLLAVGDAPTVASLLAVASGKEAGLLAARPELAELVCGFLASQHPTFFFAPDGDWHATPPVLTSLAANRLGNEHYRHFSTFEALGFALAPSTNEAECTSTLAARFTRLRSAKFVHMLVPQGERRGHHVHLSAPTACAGEDDSGSDVSLKDGR